MTRAWKLIKWISKNIIIPVNNRRPGLLLRTFVLILFFFFFNYFAEPIQYTSWEEILLLFREGEKESARQRASWNCNCSQAAGASLHADPALVLTQHLPHGTLCPPLWAVAKGGSMSSALAPGSSGCPSTSTRSGMHRGQRGAGERASDPMLGGWLTALFFLYTETS